MLKIAVSHVRTLHAENAAEPTGKRKSSSLLAAQDISCNLSVFVIVGFAYLIWSYIFFIITVQASSWIFFVIKVKRWRIKVVSSLKYYFYYYWELPPPLLVVGRYEA